jgi:hypothetical protein
MISWMIVAASVASAQDCQPMPAEGLSSTMQQALIDFAILDEEAFGAATQQVLEELPCLDEVLPPPTVAAFHRLMGLQAFFDGRDDAAVSSFRASMRIEPGYHFPSKVAPQGGKLYRLWQAAEEGPRPFESSFRPPQGMMAWVDGAEGAVRAEELPAIVQFGLDEQRLSLTALLAPGEAPPSALPGQELLARQPPAEAPAPRQSIAPEPIAASVQNSAATHQLAEAPVAEPARSGGKGGLIAATLLSGAMAGGLYGGACFMRSEYDRAPTRGNYLATNGAYFGAVGMGIASVTFGSVALFTGSR